MKICAVALALVFACTALPVHAQDLEARVAALETAVAKLNGQITANDLVGTYTVSQLSTELEGSGTFGLITTGITAGTVTLAADGTGTISVTDTEHSLNETGSVWSFTNSTQGGTGNLQWTYDNGTVMLDLGGGQSAALSAAVGGRVLIARDSSNPGPNGGHNQLVILTRLQ